MSDLIKPFYNFGPFCLDPGERILLRDGIHVPLTPKAFETLLALVERTGHIVEKEELMERIWPDTFVEEVNLAKNVSDLRRILGEGGAQNYIETIPKRGYRFAAVVCESRDGGAGFTVRERIRARVIIEEEVCDDFPEARPAGQALPLLTLPPTSAPLLPAANGELEPVGGAVPLDSRFYLTRPEDEEFHSAIVRRDSIVLVKGARQVGKTSLLARGLHQARGAGAQVVLTDFQMLNTADLESVDRLFLALAELIAFRLDLSVLPRAVWDPLHSPNFNFERFWRRGVLAEVTAPVVWGMDEVDRLFTRPYASEAFGLFRSWHNARALDPEGPWCRLTLAMAYATEAHLFITDMNQSPFNVGTRLLLEDFPPEQVAELNRRYGSPLRSETELARYFRLVGGNPYLVRRGLHHLATQPTDLATFEASADSDEGPFGDHLRRLSASLLQDPALCESVRGLMEGKSQLAAEDFYRLRSAGVITGEAVKGARLRCQLYVSHLGRHL